MKRIDNLIKLVIILIVFFSVSTIIYKFFIMPKVIIGSEFESAYAIWEGKYGIYNYDVYIKNVEEGTYKKLDKQQIRKVKGSTWRADDIGLKEGEYQFKIEPVSDGNEIKENLMESSIIKVEANDRAGFSFSKNSANGGKSSGGYLENGEIPRDAKILYITKENINDIKLDITDEKGNINQYKGICEILKNWHKETISKHLIIRIIGKVESKDVEGLEEETKSILIDNCEGVTIEGIGNDATLKGIGLIIKASSNVEIRNLGFMLYYEDAIYIKENNSNIWIHNNDFFYGEYREEDNKGKGDGAIDIRQSEYITISYNHFWDNGKTSLCGIAKDVNFITYHHNWFDHCDSRCPRVYSASVHCYNNYYDNMSKYSIAVLEGASLFAESNYFENCKYPMISVGQGSEKIYDIISTEHSGGIIKAFGNIINKNIKSLIYSSYNSTDFDAYLVNNREDIVPPSYKTIEGDIYNNFDTNKAIMYDYKVDNAENVKEIVLNKAGRLQGGNIKFNTNTLSAESYKRTTLMESRLDDMIKNY